jgi:hypothetical protein
VSPVSGSDIDGVTVIVPIKATDRSERGLLNYGD